MHENGVLLHVRRVGGTTGLEALDPGALFPSWQVPVDTNRGAPIEHRSRSLPASPSESCAGAPHRGSDGRARDGRDVQKDRAEGGTLIIHMMEDEWTDAGIRAPFTIIASDGMPQAPLAHPRSAGTFSSRARPPRPGAPRAAAHGGAPENEGHARPSTLPVPAAALDLGDGVFVLTDRETRTAYRSTRKPAKEVWSAERGKRSHVNPIDVPDEVDRSSVIATGAGDEAKLVTFELPESSPSSPSTAG